MEQQTIEQRKQPIDLAQFQNDPRANMARIYEETMKNFTEGSIVTGTVLEVRENEVIVDIGYKSEGAIPASEFRDLSSVKVGDKLEVLLDRIEDEDGMIVLSKQKADQKLRWEWVQSRYQEGGVIKGVIKSVVRGGVMVDLDGVDAFLPGSQIDVTPVRNTQSLVGQELEFKVIKISPERRNIILSRRELLEERMKAQRRELLDTIQPGQIRKGVVKNITEFGAFVDIGGLDGLLHITDMSWGRVRHPSEVVSVGQELEVAVLEVDKEKERVSLGLKQSMENPWDTIEQRYPVGSRLRGKVVNVMPYGAFVELEKGIEGLVHVSEISWTKRIAKASDVLQVGQEVDVVVLSINKEENKIALGIRQTEENPWDTVQERYPVGSRVTGTVRSFTNYGAFVELEDGIEGMIHISDMSWTRKITHPSEMLEKDQKVEAIVLEVNPQAGRISLGLRQAQEDPWNAIMARYKVGQKVKGKVSKLASFGAFIEIEEGIDGLVHISQISDQRVEKVKDALQIGQEVEARIIKLDRAERRIGLSIKAVSMSDEEFAKQHESLLEGLKPGEDIVDLAGAFDHAFGQRGLKVEEWRPGETAPSDSAAKEKPAEHALGGDEKAEDGKADPS